MARQLLENFRISGDVIDRVAAPILEERAFPPLPPSSGESTLSPEPPPAGESSIQPQEASGLTEQNAAHSAVSSEPEAEAPAPETPAVTTDGLHRVFTFGETTYRVSGAKAIFVTTLRVNIRASHEGLSHYDSLDLYMAKARSSFATSLNRAWGAETARVEKDLVRILEHFEEERDERLRAGNRKEPVRMGAEDRARGLALLEDPLFFQRIVDDLSALGYVGEDLNKQLMYLCASSRKLADPMSLLILSQSASGKSFLVDSVRRLMPPEDVVSVTSLSDQALNYIDDLTHKFLILGEAVHGEVVEHQIREMLSGKELSRLVTIKDAETGTMRSTIVRTPVIVSSVMSSTSYAVNPENASRCFVINTDESRVQTQRIHESQRKKYSLERVVGGRGAQDEIIRTHQAAQRLLKNVSIVNDFAPLLDFPAHLMRLRRDHDRFLDLIASVCFLRQYQKTVQRSGLTEYIECDLVDYEVAFRIMVEAVMASTVRELPKGAVMLYEEVRAYVKREAERQDLSLHELSFTQRQVREATGLGQTWVKYALRQLVDYEYLVISGGGRERSKAFYRLRDDTAIAAADLSMIPTPEAMKTKLEEKHREKGKLVKTGH